MARRSGKNHKPQHLQQAWKKEDIMEANTQTGSRPRTQAQKKKAKHWLEVERQVGLMFVGDGAK